jgi:predicted AlkP superfamily phosphohydrolase/phosphomutase
VIVSDHGFGPLDRDVNLNLLLERLGFLRFLPGARPSPLASLSARLKAALPGSLRDLLWRLLPPPAATRLEGLDILERTVDWRRTRAYAVGYLGGIYLNLRGREPGGIVEPADRDAVAAELAAALTSFRDPDDGLPLVTAAEANAGLYRGPRAGRLPDLVLTLKDHRCTARHSFSGPGEDLFSRPQRDFGPLAHTGSHRPDGVLLAAGPRLDGRAVAAHPSIMDLFPTCLELLGLPVPPGLDGRSLLGTSRPPSSETPEGAAGEEGPRLSPEEEEEVLGNLRDLGYV